MIIKQQSSRKSFTEKVVTAKAKRTCSVTHQPTLHFLQPCTIIIRHVIPQAANHGCSYLQVTGSLACAAVEFWLYFTKDSFIYV